MRVLFSFGWWLIRVLLLINVRLVSCLTTEHLLSLFAKAAGSDPDYCKIKCNGENHILCNKVIKRNPFKHLPFI